MKKVMKRILCLSMTFLLYSCGQTEAIQEETQTVSDAGKEEVSQAEIADSESKKDFAKLSPSKQEAAYKYRTFFLPAIDGMTQPYVGDTMLYYETV